MADFVNVYENALTSTFTSDIRGNYFVSTLNTTSGDPYILYSTDNGETFSTISTLDDRHTIIRVSSDGQYIYTYTSIHSKMYRTSDAGSTWTQLATIGGGNTFQISDNGQYVILTRPGILYVSSDYGTNFTTFSKTVQRCDTSATGQYMATVGRSNNDVYVNVSNDYGSTWTEQIINVGSSNTECEISISSTGEYMLFSIYGGNLFISSDYGVSFQEVSGTTQNWNRVEIAYNKPEYQYAQINSQTNTIWESTDYGQTWTSVYNHPNAVQYWELNSNENYLIATNRSTSKVDRYTLGATVPPIASYSISTLSNQLTLGRATIKSCLIRARTNRGSGQYVLATTNYTNEKWEDGNSAWAYISNDYGVSFTTPNLGVSLGNIYKAAGVGMDSTGQYQVILVSDLSAGGSSALYFKARVYVSTDYGATFSLFLEEPNNSTNAKHLHQGVAVSNAVNGATSSFPCYILFGDNQQGKCKVFDPVANAMKAETSANGFHTHFAMSESGEVMVAACGQNTLSKISTDYGDTWSQISTITNQNIMALDVSPDGNYITMFDYSQTSNNVDRIIYTSNDKGATWNTQTITTPNYNGGTNHIYDVAIGSNGKNQFAVGEYGQIWSSTDYGASWSRTNTSDSPNIYYAATTYNTNDEDFFYFAEGSTTTTTGTLLLYDGDFLTSGGEASTPTITSTAVVDGTAGDVYTYTFTVTDPKSEINVITAPTKPSWLSFVDNGDNTATLSGTPTGSDLGDNSVVITSTRSSDGENASQSFTITVISTSVIQPTFTSTATTEGNAENFYSYSITVTDPDNENTIITAPTLPSWLSIVDNGNNTAYLSGTPTNSNVGDNNVVIKSVRLSDGGSNTQSFTITIAAVITNLVSSWSPAPALTVVGNGYRMATNETSGQYILGVSIQDRDPQTKGTTTNSHAIYQSNDFGATFSNTFNFLSGSLETAVKISDVAMDTTGKHQAIVGIRDGSGYMVLYYSSDFGASWNVKEYYNGSSSVNSGTFTSSNNGNYYISISDEISNANANAVLPCYICIVQYDSRRHVFNPVTDTWIESSTNIKWLEVCISKTGQYMLASCRDANSTYSNDYGVTWNSIPTTLLSATSQRYRAADMTSSGQYMTFISNYTTNKGYLYRTGDFGATWDEIAVTSPYWGNFKYSQAVAVGLTGKNQMFVLHSNDSASKIFMSVDYGMTWTAQEPDAGSNELNAIDTYNSSNQDEFYIFDSQAIFFKGTATTKAIINPTPVLTSTASTTAIVDNVYTYNITFTDEEMTTITAPTLPSWLTLTDNGDNTATLTGTPSGTDLGDNAVVIRATQVDGGFGIDSFTIAVQLEFSIINSWTNNLTITFPDFTDNIVSAASDASGTNIMLVARSASNFASDTYQSWSWGSTDGGQTYTKSNNRTDPIIMDCDVDKTGTHFIWGGNHNSSEWRTSVYYSSTPNPNSKTLWLYFKLNSNNGDNKFRAMKMSEIVSSASVDAGVPCFIVIAYSIGILVYNPITNAIHMHSGKTSGWATTTGGTSNVPITFVENSSIVSIGTFSDFYDCAISETGKYIVTIGNKIYLSTDYGVTFTRIDTNITGWTGTCVAGDISPSGEYITLANTAGTVYYSSSFGSSWNSTTISGVTQDIISLKINSTGVNQIVGGKAGTMFQSFDYGQNWSIVPSIDSTLSNTDIMNKIDTSTPGQITDYFIVSSSKPNASQILPQHGVPGNKSVVTLPGVPTITSTAETDGLVGTVYTYNITVTDDDNEITSISAISIPSWLTLTDNGDNTATISGTPTSDNIGSNSVLFKAERSSDGGKVFQEFTINVDSSSILVLSWEKLVDLNDLNGMYRMVTNSDSGQYLLAIAVGVTDWKTTNNTQNHDYVFSSNDYGSTWKGRSLNGGFTMNSGSWQSVVRYSDASMDPTGQYQVFLARRSDNGRGDVWFYYSSDYGATWDLKEFYQVGIDGNPTSYGSGTFTTSSSGNISVSISKSVSSPHADAFFPCYISIVQYGSKRHMYNPKTHVWTEESTNGGWLETCMSKTGRYVLVSRKDGESSYSSDYGVTWNNIPMSNFTADTSQDYFAADMSDTGKYMTILAGYTIDVVYVYRSTDYGATWSAVSLNLPRKNFAYVYSVSVGVTGENQMAVLESQDGNNSRIYISKDYGETWILQTDVASTSSLTAVDNYKTTVGDDTFDNFYIMAKNGELYKGNKSIGSKVVLAPETGTLTTGTDFEIVDETVNLTNISLTNKTTRKNLLKTIRDEINDDSKQLKVNASVFGDSTFLKRDIVRIKYASTTPNVTATDDEALYIILEDGETADITLQSGDVLTFERVSADETKIYLNGATDPFSTLSDDESGSYNNFFYKIGSVLGYTGTSESFSEFSFASETITNQDNVSFTLNVDPDSKAYRVSLSNDGTVLFSGYLYTYSPTQVLSSELQNLFTNQQIVLSDMENMLGTNLRNMSKTSRPVFYNIIDNIVNLSQTQLQLNEQILAKYENNSTFNNSQISTIVSNFVNVFEPFGKIFEKSVQYRNEIEHWDSNVFQGSNIKFSQAKMESKWNLFLSHLGSQNFLTSLTISNGGSNNTEGDVLNLSTTSSVSNAVAIVSDVSNGSVTELIITNHGGGFTVNDTLTVTSSNGSAVVPTLVVQTVNEHSLLSSMNALNSSLNS